MPLSRAGIVVCEDPERVVQTASAMAREAAQAARVRAGRFAMMVADADLTRRTLHMLAAVTLAWREVHVFAADDQSAAAALGVLPAPRRNLHLVTPHPGDAHAAAVAYEGRIRASFGVAGGELPRFDLALLALHADGRIAGLFPHSSSVDETERLAVAHYIRGLDRHGVTLTAPVINQSREVVLLAAGEAVGGALAAALDADPRPQPAPARLLTGCAGRLRIVVDAQAARHVPAERRSRPAAPALIP